jgi:RHS repeat-associated protein
MRGGGQQDDALRRLTDVTVNGTLAEHFEYDPNGNRTLGFSAATGLSHVGVYDDQDRLLSYGPWEFTYTANGELESKLNTDTDEEWLFQYDVLGNLLSVGLPNGDLVEYLVDGVGRRVGKKKNGVLLKQWIYRDALKPVAELDGSGNLVAQFVYGSKRNVPDYILRNGVAHRVISDHLGSPRYVVNIANASEVPFSANYTGFGEVTGTGLDWMPFGFAGGIYDAESGLVRFGARDFDPRVGRWTAKDPILFDGDGPNLYGYVLGDPVTRIDDSGQGVVDCAKAIAEYLRLRDKLNQRKDENACNPDAGHDKAIDQLGNAVDRAREKVARHCKDPETLIELGILGLIGGALLVPGMLGAPAAAAL